MFLPLSVRKSKMFSIFTSTLEIFFFLSVIHVRSLGCFMENDFFVIAVSLHLCVCLSVLHTHYLSLSHTHTHTLSLSLILNSMLRALLCCMGKWLKGWGGAGGHFHLNTGFWWYEVYLSPRLQDIFNTRTRTGDLNCLI